MVPGFFGSFTIVVPPTLVYNVGLVVPVVEVVAVVDVVEVPVVDDVVSSFLQDV